MRILLIHTYYTLRGGEDAVFEQEYTLLKKDHEIDSITFVNQNGIQGGMQFLTSIWNLSAAKKVKKKIKDFRPDVIHIHNWHFASGPLIIRTATSFNIPVVLTLHNYRILCPSATLLHNGEIFLESLNSGFPWQAVKNKVYRESLIQTFWLSVIVYFHKKINTWSKVSQFITLTVFAQQLFQENLAIKATKFVVKPNFSGDNHEKGSHQENFLFIGRLSQEKGINVLLEATRDVNAKFLIGGKGPMQSQVEKYTELENISYLGDLSSEMVREYMLKCSALIFPSIWYEGMPMTIIEAFSTSTPVIASNLGSMASMVTHGFNGLLFEPGNVKDLQDKLLLWESLNSDDKAAFRQNARATYEKYYMPMNNLNILLDYYCQIT